MKAQKHISKFEFFTIIYAVIFLAAFAVTWITPFIFIAMIDIIVGNIFILSSKVKPYQNRGSSCAVMIGIIVILSIFVILTPPINLHTDLASQYKIQEVYVSLYNNVKRPEWFPLDIADIKTEGFAFDYMPSVLQGTGHYSITLKVSPEQLTAYEELFSERAKLTVKMSDYGDMYKLTDDEAKLFTNFDNILDIYADEAVKDSDTAVIYVLDAVLNFNHPHSSAVILDKENGIVQFSELG